ncbi:MAG: hypothetical protein GKC05_07350, partial [Methanomicrobiales archaeon]|nr:hypothetical protein [Methanomicrobiales archaeon]
GIMAGLSPVEILLAVGIGATIECLVFALGSEIIIRLLATNTTLGLAVAVYFLASRYTRRKASG